MNLDAADESGAARIAQAQGMVSVQADCTIQQALLIMMERALVERRSLERIADAVVDGVIRFGQ